MERIYGAILLALFFLLLTSPGLDRIHGTEIKVISETRDTLTIGLYSDEPERTSVTSNGQTYDLFSIADTGFITQAGKPLLPGRDSFRCGAESRSD